jgi:hypothetical protein
VGKFSEGASLQGGGDVVEKTEDGRQKKKKGRGGEGENWSSDFGLIIQILIIFATSIRQ